MVSIFVMLVWAGLLGPTVAYPRMYNPARGCWVSPGDMTGGTMWTGAAADGASLQFEPALAAGDLYIAGLSYTITVAYSGGSRQQAMIGSNGGSWTGGATACSYDDGAGNVQVGQRDAFAGTWTAPLDGADVTIGGTVGYALRNSKSIAAVEATALCCAVTATPLPTSAPTPVPTTTSPTSPPSTASPTAAPTPRPTASPLTASPIATPSTPVPTASGFTFSPTGSPSTLAPTADPTTAVPTNTPTAMPSSSAPTQSPTVVPSPAPSASPASSAPTAAFVGWTAATLQQNTVAGSSTTCFMALFSGTCGTDGGVYLISEAWYSDHSGGSIIQQRCGLMVDNWLTKGSHGGRAGDLTAKADMTQGPITRATYIADFQCPTPTPTTRAPTTTAPTTTAPTPAPTAAPTVTPTPAPSVTPTPGPTGSPVTPSPTATPTTPAPTSSGVTFNPTRSPSTLAPTADPTTAVPTNAPTAAPSSSAPTRSPTIAPSPSPSASPTSSDPTASPTSDPTASPAVVMVWTAATLQQHTVAGSSTTCFMALFSGTCGTDGGVYLISEAWWSDHSGGAIIQQRCGLMVDNWLTKGSHGGRAGDLTAKADMTQGPITRATYIADFQCPTAAMPTSAPTTSRPTSLSPTTVSPSATPTPGPTASPVTPSPTVAPTTPAPTALGVTFSPTASPSTLAPTNDPTTTAPTHAPTAAPSSSVPSQLPTASPTSDPTASPAVVMVWTAATLQQHTVAGSSTTCFMALFSGTCGTDGGVYLISEAWWAGHSGGAIIQERCGLSVDNWLAKGSHGGYAAALAAKADMSSYATYVADFQCPLPPTIAPTRIGQTFSPTAGPSSSDSSISASAGGADEELTGLSSVAIGVAVAVGVGAIIIVLIAESTARNKLARGPLTPRRSVQKYPNPMYAGTDGAPAHPDNFIEGYTDDTMARQAKNSGGKNTVWENRPPEGFGHGVQNRGISFIRGSSDGTDALDDGGTLMGEVVMGQIEPDFC